MDKQQYAIEQILSGKNIFLTGSGGVGKSWVIKQVSDNNTILCAPTGIAALNIGGITCHRAFGLPLGLPQERDYFSVSDKVSSLFYGDNVKRIIIDEISMVRTDYLGVINRKLQIVKGNDKPFGGIQVVVVGDFFQLEPILTGYEAEYFEYESPFCFTSPCWEFETIELTDVKRQSDRRQVLMLNSIRKKDKHYKKALKYIQNECKPYEQDPDTLHLCCYNADADDINQQYYDTVEGEERTFFAKFGPRWGKERPVAEVLPLKVGARVLICANDQLEAYVNGDRGTITGFSDIGVYVHIDGRPEDDRVHVVESAWEKHSYKKVDKKLSKEVEDTYIQMPIRLGWAVSVHKSQGMTLNDVAIHIGRGCFSHGQLYVALSRIKDLKNLSFKVLVEPCDVIVKPEVKEFYAKLSVDNS